jgi:hypothetical protein
LYALHSKQMRVSRRAVNVLENLSTCATHEGFRILDAFEARTGDKEPIEVDRIDRGNGVGHRGVDKT